MAKGKSKNEEYELEVKKGSRNKSIEDLFGPQPDSGTLALPEDVLKKFRLDPGYLLKVKLKSKNEVSFDIIAGKQQQLFDESDD